MNLPDGWRSMCIDDLTTYLTSGISRPFSDENIGLPVLRSNNVKWGLIDLEEIKYWYRVDPRGEDLVAVTPLAGDILINFVNGSRSELGKAALYNGELSPCIASTNFFIVRFNEKVMLPKYANLFFQSNEYKKVLDKIVGFTGQGSFNKRELGRVILLVPPLAEQKRIAEVVSTWDEAIEKVGKLIEAKQKLKRGLMQQLLTKDRRFRAFKDQKWQRKRLRDVAERVTRKNDSGCSHVLTASGEHGLVDQAEFFDRAVASEDLSDYFLLRRGEFAYNRSSMNGYPFGATKRLDRYEQGVLSILYICFCVDRTRANPDFMAHLFDSGLLNRGLRAITQVGARAHGLLNVTPSDFMELEIELPSMEEQLAITNTLSAADRELAVLAATKNMLEQQKRGLMQRLLTGEIRTVASTGHPEAAHA